MIPFNFSVEFILKEDTKDNREKIKEVLRQWNEADQELERVCKELGIPKPELVCHGDYYD